MLGKKFYADVADATVIFTRKGGQGVLVNNDMIITAAHCIDCNCDGFMPRGDYTVEEIKTSKGEFKVSPLAIEPISDIAVLGPVGDEVGFKEAMRFQDFCRITKSVPVYEGDFKLFEEVRVHIYTHKGTWVTGRATQTSIETKTLDVDTDEKIEGGTSGGPIINDSGELVGVTSIGSSTSTGHHDGIAIPRPHLTLPVWVCREIFEDISEQVPQENADEILRRARNWSNKREK